MISEAEDLTYSFRGIGACLVAPKPFRQIPQLSEERTRDGAILIAQGNCWHMRSLVGFLSPLSVESLSSFPPQPPKSSPFHLLNVLGPTTSSGGTNIRI